MRIVNQYTDPYCLKAITATWAQSGTVKTTADGEHWRYDFPGVSSLIPEKTSDVTLVAVEMTPAATLDTFMVENAAILRQSDGLLAVDVSKETRQMVSIVTKSETSVTLTGMLYATMSEWPILEAVGADIFAADTAAY